MWSSLRNLYQYKVRLHIKYLMTFYLKESVQYNTGSARLHEISEKIRKSHHTTPT